MEDTKKHWDKIFQNTSQEKLGWFESDYKQTLKFINKISEIKKKSIFLAGAGTTMLVDELIGNCKKLFLNDISNESLSIVRERVNNFSQDIEWINSDIAEKLAVENSTIDIWIDRAVLHFLKEEHQINGYFKNLKNLLKIGGHAIIAEFSKEGASKCAGLELHQYSVKELIGRLGSSFELLEHENYTFINPNGDERPYIYTLFKKLK